MDEEKQVEELENNMPEEINQQEENTPDVRRTGESLAQEEEKEEQKEEGKNEKKPEKKKRVSIITLIILVLVAVALVLTIVFLRPKDEVENDTTESRTNTELEKYCISGNDINDFYN